MDTERRADDVFGLLADEIRLDILRTVAKAQQDQRLTGVADLSFSDLYERVDVDGTSKLSYHLGELTGTFLRKHETGYAFTHAGERMVRFILADNYRQPSDFGAVETAGTCLHCGESGLKATLHDQYFLLQCQACDRPNFSYTVTPAQVRTHDGAALIDAVTRALVADLLELRGGVCPACAGRIETEVIDASDVPIDDSVPASYTTISECNQCLRFMSLPLTHAAAYHRESVAFHWEHGVDILDTGMWEFHGYLLDGQWTATRGDTEPDRYRVELHHDATTLRLYLDEEATVTRTERIERRDQQTRQSG